MTHFSTKNYPPSLGLSACFRQWRANSHCQYLHGYALGFRFKFQAKYLDQNGWVVDFGGLKKLKECLVNTFDHKVIVAYDDPQLATLKQLEERKLAQVLYLPGVGCERFAEQMFVAAQELIDDARVQVISCECYEHEANSAIYEKEKDD